ncbi:hypothetical protein C475_11570 [Halosimplex carlsbadense 2-9-1]|uniref:Halobacterial output domain-containing protein n=1 Tax=Halosimplex carlsbadense 2-9-1 TaxID=797114 RepID=M0CQG1_9EURY|nr:HalOD1 output domain-containing protein [Halosimplex carlsbadense]ELZ24873.1 hypothetical protein C475_11570 [Halosimplex carlsbadense 2-9-1]
MEADRSTAVLSVLETVAAAERIDPIDLPPLSDAVDPEALNDLFRPPTGDRAVVTVGFEYCGYEITVDGPDAVTAEPVASAATAVGTATSGRTDASDGSFAD